MPTADSSWTDIIGILSVLLLVAANGFFVASEFSLVAVRRSRVAQLVAAGRANAKALLKAINNLDANLVACQLGITISSLALGWIGEPALATLIEPSLGSLLGSLAATGAHAIAITIAFSIITILHIVLNSHRRAWRYSAVRERPCRSCGLLTCSAVCSGPQLSRSTDLATSC